MGRKIRLTESEFRRLVKRLVRETEEKMGEDEVMDKIEDKVSKATKNMSSDEIMDAISGLEKLQKKLDRKGMLDMSVSEISDEHGLNELSEEDDNDLESRKFRRNKRMKVGAGVATSLAGLLGLASQGMGYLDVGDTFTYIHDLVKSIGGEYAPLMSLGTLFGGLIYALKNAAEEKEDIRESYYRRKYGY